MKLHPMVVGALGIVLLGALLALLLGKPAEAPAPVVNSFEECVAHYPVMESDPRQCQTPDERVFTEEKAVDPMANLIQVDSLVPGDTISSPLVVTGSARGTWYFEASFPIEVRDSANNVIGQGYGQAQGEWMTEDFVPFISSSITFPLQPTGSTGTVILRKDNPSALPENDASIEIPIVF